jgi:four helix bundle protein
MDQDAKASAPPILDRSVAYSLRVVKLYRELEKDSVGRVLGKQLLRSGTSIGANLHEGQAAQSRPDFIAKLHIAFKEARESAYWLRLIGEADLIAASRLKPLRDETAELIKILSSILVATKRGLKSKSALLA